MGNRAFEWYEILKEGAQITQGDILINFPVVKPNNYDKFLECYLKNDLDGFKINNRVECADYIVLTQACDLAREKPEMGNIILCRIYDAKEVGFGKNKLERIGKGEQPQFYLLNENMNFRCEYKEDGFDFHIVDFNEIEKIPKEIVINYAKSINSRLRLLPPYREHLAQAFARYFMRIGLPSDIDREKLTKFKS